MKPFSGSPTQQENPLKSNSLRGKATQRLTRLLAEMDHSSSLGLLLPEAYIPLLRFAMKKLSLLLSQHMLTKKVEPKSVTILPVTQEASADAGDSDPFGSASMAIEPEVSKN